MYGTISKTSSNFLAFLHVKFAFTGVEKRQGLFRLWIAEAKIAAINWEATFGTSAQRLNASEQNQNKWFKE